jgi:hypothetical protein
MIRMRMVVPAMVAAFTLSGSTPPVTRTASSGDLLKPLDQYTGEEFFVFATRLPVSGGNERARGCRGDAECGRGKRTNVRIDAVSDADSLGPGTVGPNGTVAARVINRGQDAEGRYGMQGGGRMYYFLVVMPGGATWRLEELDTQGRTHRAVASGRLVGCNHRFTPGARADFKTCASAGGRSTISLVSFAQGTDDPMWISCASGCCTAEGF